MKRHKKIIIICTLFVVLATIGGAGSYFYSKSNKESSISFSKFSTCEDESFRVMVVDEEITLSKNIEKLQPVVENIKSVGSYESSPNCMLLLTMYAVNTGDAKNAVTYHDKLTKAYGDSKGYSGTLSTAKVQSPEDLASVVAFTAKAQAVNGQAFEWDGKQPK